MILNQGSLRLTDGFLNRVKLLRDIEARARGLDHLDHTAQMPLRSLEPFCDLGM